MTLHPGPRPTAPTDPHPDPDAELAVARDPGGRVVALTGDGVRHRRRDAEGGWTMVDDPAGATALRQDEERTELLRDGLLLAQHRLRGAEEWTLPGTPGTVRIERDADGEVRGVLVGGRVAAARADGESTRVLRWASGDVGHGPDGLHAVGRSGGRRDWAAAREGDRLSLGRDRYRFDAQGRVVEHRHPETGRTGYVFAGSELVAVEAPSGRVELLHGADGRVRVRRDPDGRTTYGYDAERPPDPRDPARRHPATGLGRAGPAGGRGRRHGLVGPVRLRRVRPPRPPDRDRRRDRNRPAAATSGWSTATCRAGCGRSPTPAAGRCAPSSGTGTSASPPSPARPGRRPRTRCT